MIDDDTGKSSRDLKELGVIQTSAKDHRLKLVWKIRKENK